MHNEQPKDVKQIRQFDALCDQFEEQLKNGNDPQIESYLEMISGESMRDQLFRELLELEMHYQSAFRKTIKPVDYKHRFPDKAEVVEELLAPKQTPLLGADDTVVQKVTSKSLPYEFGNYIVMDEIGRGGMGVVYKAQQKNPDRLVALKMINAESIASNEHIERFRSEANAVAQLDHPNIVPVYEAGEFCGQHYYSMALVPGENLEDKITDGTIEFRAAAELVQTIAAAVQHSHEKGIIHRDLKPANVLMANQEGIEGPIPKITDFGLAKWAEADVAMTLTGQVMGTPAYMSPEQAIGESRAVDGRSDIYSIGVILFKLLTGELPFRGSNQGLLAQIAHEEPPPPRRLNPSIPKDLETICLKCLSKKASQRYQSCRELSMELQRYLSGKAIIARPLSRLVRVWRWYQLRVVEVAAVAALCMVTLSVFDVLVRFLLAHLLHVPNNDDLINLIWGGLVTFLVQGVMVLLASAATSGSRAAFFGTSCLMFFGVCTGITKFVTDVWQIEKMRQVEDVFRTNISMTLCVILCFAMQVHAYVVTGRR